MPKCNQCGSSNFQATVTKKGQANVQLIPDGDNLYTVDYLIPDIESDIVQIFCADCNTAVTPGNWEIDDNDFNKGKFIVRIKEQRKE